MAPSQPSLFGEPPSKKGGVGPVEASPEQRALADRLPSQIRLGTSSWSFPGWQGIVYDREASVAVLAKSGLAAYARHPLLRAVGIDRTFYAPLPAAALGAYAAQVPDDFRFVVKASSRCTSPWIMEDGRAAGRNDLYLSPGFARDECVEPYAAGLGAKAGSLVFQFPPQDADTIRRPDAFAERLESFLSSLPRGPAYAVEIRDRALLTARYLQALESAGASHCVSVHPKMPPAAHQLDAASKLPRSTTVVRWMLGAGLGYEQARARYDPFSRLVDEDAETRDVLANAALERAFPGHVVFVIVNNKAEGSAPLSVFRLAERIAERSLRTRA